MPRYTTGKPTCNCTLNPLSRNSYARQPSYALSRRPGPSAECTFMAAPMIALEISLSSMNPLRPLRPLWLSDVLNNSGSAHAAAYAHGHDAILAVTALQVANDGRGEFRASAAERMAERDRAAVRVHFCRIDARFFDHR